MTDFFEVTLRTVENYLSHYEEELAHNGYEVIKGNRLKSFKSVLQEMDVPEIYFGNIAKTPQSGSDIKGIACQAAVHAVTDHFPDGRKMVNIGTSLC